MSAVASDHGDQYRFVRRAWAAAGVASGLVIVVDQLTKSWAEANLVDGPIHVVGGLQLDLVYNRGIAFGLGPGAAPILVALAVAGIVLTLFGKRLTLTLLATVGAGCVLGGALSNVGDRLFRSHSGAVVDFIDARWWPVFNVADSAIVAGSLLLVLAGSRKDQ